MHLSTSAKRNQVSLWGHFRVMLGSLWGHVGIILGSSWDHFGVILGSFWGHLGIILRSFLNHFGVILGRSQKYFQIFPNIFPLISRFIFPKFGIRSPIKEINNFLFDVRCPDVYHNYFN